MERDGANDRTTVGFARFPVDPQLAMAGAPHPPPHAAVEEALARILASPEFTASARNRQFLSYVVEETLAGRGDQIKAYSVATSVFGRGSDFDPQLDSIVRIEAGRLRRALERYYLTDGRADAVRIGIPTGGYVPIFESARRATEPLMAEPVRAPVATVLIGEFERLGGGEAAELLSRLLASAMVARLTGELAADIVYPTALRREAGFRNESEPPRQDAQYLLTGSAAILNETASVDAMLAEIATGRVVWAMCLEHPIRAADLATARREIADAFVASLARRIETLDRIEPRISDRSPDEALTL